MPDSFTFNEKTKKMNIPSMKIWTDTWHNADAEEFKNVYSDNGIIFPPNKPTVKGNANILDFMKSGLGKVDVLFEPEKTVTDGKIAFEYGIFKDADILNKKIIEQGQYSVTWIMENSVWKILCHAWSMPEKL